MNVCSKLYDNLIEDIDLECCGKFGFQSANVVLLFLGEAVTSIHSDSKAFVFVLFCFVFSIKTFVAGYVRG